MAPRDHREVAPLRAWRLRHHAVPASRGPLQVLTRSRGPARLSAFVASQAPTTLRPNTPTRLVATLHEGTPVASPERQAEQAIPTAKAA
jgi:hypothetical protein